MKKVNWAVLSTGKIAHTFTKALAFVEAANLYAVSSRSAQKAADFAAQYGFSKSFGSKEEMLADPGVEVVYIASPMSCHYEDAKACLSAGKHVLCEKTVTLNSQQLEELLALAKFKKLFFMEAMWMKCLPVFRTAKQWVEEGRIGHVRMIKADFLSLCVHEPENRLFRNDLGGGALLDLGVYPITFAMAFLGGTPSEIVAAAHMKNEVDYDNFVALRYENGASAVLTSAFDCCTGTNSAFIIGDQGMIALEPWFFCGQNIKCYDGGNHLIEEKYLPHPCNGYEYEIEEVNRCLLEGWTESPLVPWVETRQVMAVIDEVKRQIGLKYVGEIMP